MPTYLTPGVYIEEVPSANKPIEGVSTSVAAFVGLAPGGPVNQPVRISNWTQFARIFGDTANPEHGPFMEGAYLAHSVYGFFQNGGSPCWIVRGGGGGGGGPPAPPAAPPAGAGRPGRPRTPRSRPTASWRSTAATATSASRSPRSPAPATGRTRPTP